MGRPHVALLLLGRLYQSGGAPRPPPPGRGNQTSRPRARKSNLPPPGRGNQTSRADWLADFLGCPKGCSKASRCVAAAAPAFAAMEDLPAVEPVKIYENTYRLEPADTERCAASGGANAPGAF